jgi:hypothetical protein
MINCRPYYLPRAFSSVCILPVYIPQQSEADTKTGLNELYFAISKQENAHIEAALLLDGDFNAGKLKSVSPNFYQHVKCATRRKKTSTPHKEKHVKFSLALHLTNLTIILSS